MRIILISIIKTILHFLYIFPVKRNYVYLINFNGLSYGGDAKAIADYLHENYYKKYKIYMEVQNKNNFVCSNPEIIPVNKKSMLSIYYSMICEVIICNFVPKSYVPYRKEQIIINTWHGNPLKKVGKYAINYNKDAYLTASCYTSHSKQYTDLVIRDSFEFNDDVLCCGAPRNDIFFDQDRYDKASKIKSELNLDNKKIVLYAPTFRGDFKQEEMHLDVYSLLKALKEKDGGDWVLLYRLHPMVSLKEHCMENSFIIDVSQYPDMQDLLLITDLLITDYSSSMWDFSLQFKPVILFTYDLDKYIDERGVYYSIKSLPYPICLNNQEVISCIKDFDYVRYTEDLKKYFNKVQSYENGNSIAEILNYINKKRK